MTGRQVRIGRQRTEQARRRQAAAGSIEHMPDSPPIHGQCDARFADVREAFARGFREHGEVDAAVAMTVEGRVVVDLWGGWMDQERTSEWRADTVVNVFSVGKALATAALLRLVERGAVALDAPVARYWPELAQNGKGAIRVRALLGHRAGLPAIRRLLPDRALYDWTRMSKPGEPVPGQVDVLSAGINRKASSWEGIS